MSDSVLPERRAARLAGLLFLLPFLFYATGDNWMSSLRTQQNYLSTLGNHSGVALQAGALLLANSVDVVVLGVLVWPALTRAGHPRVALLYVLTRAAEAGLLMGGILAQLLLLPLADAYNAAAAAAAAAATPVDDETAAAPSVFLRLADIVVHTNFLCFQAAMLLLGLGSLPLCVALYRTRLLPRVLAAWGGAGYALLAAGAILELSGVAGVGVPLAIPGGLCEMAWGMWLLARGFGGAETGGVQWTGAGVAARQQAGKDA